MRDNLAEVVLDLFEPAAGTLTRHDCLPTAPRTRRPRGRPASDPNRLQTGDAAFHEWYRFVLSFPPHLVRDYLERFALTAGATVLDPFCGTGTTVVEARRLGFTALGIEANPVAYFASMVKVDWDVDPNRLRVHARRVADEARETLVRHGVPDLTADGARPTVPLKTVGSHSQRILLTGSISPLPLHKALVLIETLDRMRDPAVYAHERLALARTLVSDASNLKFGPEVGVGKPKADAAVVAPWLAAVERMARDVTSAPPGTLPATVHNADARELASVIAPGSVQAVITSPPYPNEKDYSRTTRLESVLLGFTPDMHALREVKKRFVRSNTRSMYAADQDDRWVEGHPEIERIAEEIERRRIALGKTSGFERRYARLTKLYFGGMARHLADLRPLLASGARLAYVVGDQASYLQVMIRTGTLLADIARRLGYTVEDIDLFRTRIATATREQLREEVVVLRWEGM